MRSEPPRDPYLAHFDTVAAVSFAIDRKGNVSGRHNGAVVLRDRASEDVISPGEMWFCSLRMNPYGMGNYFARAIRKIDASFFMELCTDQKKGIAEVLWDTCRDEVAAAIAEMQAVPKEVYERTAEDYERRIEDLTEKLDEQSERETCPTVRNTPDGLMSSEFRTGRYSVRVSADGKSLLLTPDDCGEAECRGNLLSGDAIRRVMPFRGGPSVPCRRYGGGVLVSL